jgi:hypothetical protein
VTARQQLASCTSAMKQWCHRVPGICTNSRQQLTMCLLALPLSLLYLHTSYARLDVPACCVLLAG